VPGVLKNALDWVVGSGETVDKPFALLNASPRSTYAQAALTEILKTMAARVVAEACVAVPVAGKNLDEAAIVAHSEIAPALRAALEAFARAISAPSDSAARC
jgi:NAD(P)H-dependent FMN reductase